MLRLAERLERLLWVVVGMLLGAGAALIGFIAILDWLLGGPACEPDEGGGCGAAVVMLAAVYGLPFGAGFGGILANLLIQWLQCHVKQATKDEPV